MLLSCCFVLVEDLWILIGSCSDYLEHVGFGRLSQRDAGDVLQLKGIIDLLTKPPSPFKYMAVLSLLEVL